MRKSLLTTFTTAALCLVFHAAAAAGARGQQQQQPPLVGGYSEASAQDREVQRAARFAVREEGRRVGRALTLLAVRRAETQVVAGLNYRLRLSVGYGGRAREVSAVVFKSLRGAYSLSSWEAASADAPTREVKVYLVALNDAGKRGRKIGCDDSLVAVTRSVKDDGAPLKAAVRELLSMPREYEGDLGNYWFGERLRVTGATISRGTATIRIAGQVFVAGICDEPRIEEQIKETALQFPGVRRVNVFVNGRPLSRVIR